MFRFYIYDPFEGSIKGTDSLEDAMDYAQSEDFHVVDAQAGENLLPDGTRSKVAAIASAD